MLIQSIRSSDLGVRDLSPTWFLYDEGEEHFEIKLHLGAGGIYLVDTGTGYINCDIAGDVVARDDPAVALNRTTIRDYYARLNGTANALPTRRRTLVDMQTNFIDPPFPPSSVDKIVCIQALEHLNAADVHLALSRWWKVLRPGGILVLAVPYMDGALEWLADPATHDFAVRHLQGSERDQYNHHKSWFNPADLEWLLDLHGFTAVETLPNFHVYPAIVRRARKLDRYVPDRSYRPPLPGYDENCQTVLDVGPGKFPLSTATRCFDVSE